MKYDYLLIDASHMLARCTHTTDTSDILGNDKIAKWKVLDMKEDRTPEEESELKQINKEYLDVKTGITLHTFINTLFSSIEKFDSKRVVVAWDCGSWRYDIFPEYKQNRKLKREQQTDVERDMWAILKEKSDCFHQLLNQHTNVVSVKMKDAEADDIIATVANDFDGKSMIISSDSDFHQLLQNPNTDMYDPIKAKMIDMSISDAAYSLLFKCIRGDRSDNIPSAWPRMKEKPYKNFNIEKPSITDLFEDKSVLKHHRDKGNEFSKQFNLNEQLISFSHIPNIIKDMISADVIEQLTYTHTYDVVEWIAFCREHDLKVMIDDLDRVKDVLF